MTSSDYNRIKFLLDESGLLNSNKLPHSFSSNFNFNGETILITGAAGSIGSELARQLVKSRFKNLVLVDNAESPLYHLFKEFENNPKIEFVLVDIRDDEAMTWLFQSFKPTIVIHTAAYKHVPVMEDNAYEAIKLNILATKTLADLAITFKVKKFVFISTDKAVNPIGVMGMSKRIAESYLNYLSSKKKTLFLTTRFGNVLGSSGSVLPIFLKQIESGTPLTVTSKETTRFFINLNKICRLLLEITSWDKPNSNLYTFNMGTPIKIIDLAKVLLNLTGEKNPIEIIGLRPGEKTHEEITSKEESLEPTMHLDIYKVSPKIEYSNEIATLHKLKLITPTMSNQEVKSILEDCIYKLQCSPTLLFAI